ncbi:uncharacterized protein Tco_1079353 [Tanacetum coccineum]|uniref:DUF4218 domain-containing protein n=1 Tax=Tanacetum coccineum TaxID=301880 RepID=A0ABQ5HRW3_9ASTR
MYKDSISTHPLNVARLEARLAMEKNPDDHPCESAAILHELLNEMENLRVEPALNRNSPEFKRGLNDFYERCKAHINDRDTTLTSNEPPKAAGPIKYDMEGLFEMENEELFPACTWMSSLDFLAKFAHLKVLHKLTDTSFDDTMKFLLKAFPTGAKIPKTYYEAKKSMKKVGLGYESIDACINDCCFFWGKKNKDEQICPTCKASRWKNKDTTKKKVPNKVLRYFPLIPRLKRLYGSLHTAKHMIWHATGKCTEDGKMGHPVDGKAWKEFDKKNSKFAKEHRNVRLGLAADDFNPFGNLSQSYSIWLLIPGPKSPGKDMDVYLQPLVKELKTLWKKPGVKTLDVATNTEFSMRAMLLWTISDFPARSSLSGWSGQGYLACPTCNEETPSTRVNGKTAYVGHRRFLPLNHHWRNDKTFNGKSDKRPAQKKLTSTQILEQLSDVPSCIPGKHPSYEGVKRQRNPIVEKNWSKRSIFYELPYWSSLTLKHNLDVMHIEKNVLESLLGTLLMNDKSKDTNKARQDLEELKIRPELWLSKKGNGKFIKPHPKYSFPPEKRRKFYEFIKGVKLPDGFGSNFKPKVTDNDNNIIGMKSHDYHIMIQRLLPARAQAYLDSNIATPIIELCSFFKQICARSIKESDMLIAEDQLVHILCNFEQIYPPAFFDIMIHLVMHLPAEAILGGPVYMRWMYPFERYMKKLKNYVRNKARPEGCIAEGYIAEEALTFCSHYLRNVPTRFNRPDRNDDGPPPTSELEVFRSVCTPKSVGVVKSWITKFKEDSMVCPRQQECCLAMPENDLPTKFSPWFRDKISTLYTKNPSECSLELFALASEPKDHATYYTSCIVNGVKFVVRSRDERLITQNSGVLTPGENGSMFYEDLEYTRLSGAGPSTEVSFIPTSRVNDDDFIDDDVEYDAVHTMAMVVREDGPPDDDTWEPRPIKKNAKGRKKGSDAALIRKFELGEKKRLSIKFDLHELRTAKPIGPNRRHFTGLIGNEIERSVPFCYESWDLVPDKHKGTIWPAINVTYFDMKEHLSGPNAKQVEKGMELQFKGQYRNRKNKFKDEMFVSRGGYENPVKMRNFPPPGKSLSEWHELCDHFTSEKHLAHSAKNKANRAKLPQCSTQGSKSYAASRHEEWETNGVFPDLIELYKKTHQKEGKWAKDVFEARYIKMLKLRASQEGLEEKMTDDEIMDKVLGSSRAFKPGRGRNLPKSTSSSSVCNYPSPEPLVSKSALRRFVEAHNQQMKDWHAQLADKNIELRLPAPLDPNALLEDDAEPRDAADVLEDAAEPGEE